jgi:glycine/D-amino acid oxidase-like deaminating enzyme
LSDKVAIITAGGSGIGAARARRLASDGFRVAIFDTSEKAEALAKELGDFAVTGSNQSNDDLMLIFPSHGFVITPLSTGLRIGGAVEFAGLRRPPNFAHSEAMLRKAQAFLPGLDGRGGKQWMGYRPSLPDSVPVIGHAKGRRNVFYAFEHGHLGLTQSAATGQLIRHLMLDQAPPGLDLSPFSPRRFRT